MPWPWPPAPLFLAILAALGALAIGYGFHNAFMGVEPFTLQIFTGDPDFWPAIGITAGASGFLIFVLIPVRVLIQHWQRHAIVAHMAPVIVPNQVPVHRRELMARMVAGLLELRPESRVAYLRTMNEALATASLEARTTVTREMVTRMTDMMGAVSELPEEQRRMMVQAMSALVG